ncbi:3-deoxy-manno-octulosonate cytidylyltransferase [Maribrevibacterium harenarium]|uniref:3-deoxy-manno-octulosonate cytidylyltransferase n=1 Tax=Maribrevibacterium harenarium TaxID=2589817 RepID=A0A501WLD2_9GAMM|nr:3-deoxy-manno-octulosonate cytidylyltransferase [Maribrevibacterium harenarium]TPE50309.1 3-deoxy-manno-octulosonate cytidylyltransferase [Maribrevibacterium harenarium]
MTDLPEFHIVVPARYASSRFPQKLLADLNGKPVVQWVYELALTAGAQSVTIATDHQAIYDAAKGFGATVVMTRDDHENGTERLAEVAASKGWFGDEIIVNVQGDEPLLPIELIHQAVAALASDPDAQMSTLACPIQRSVDIFNPNVVKVVRDEKGRALYFSRATIPWDRDGFANGAQTIAADYPAYRHIGLYVYRAQLLARYASMPMSPLEKWEKLEQLRFLHQGVPVQVGIAAGMPPHGVDTPEDLDALRRHLGA